MDYRLTFDITLNIDYFKVEDVDSLEEAKQKAEQAIKELFYGEADVQDAKLNLISHQVVGETLTAKVTNISLFENDLQSLVPKEITVKFYYSEFARNYDSRDFYGNKRDPLTWCVESAVEDRLNEMKGLEDVSVRHCDFEIIDTESGEPFND